MNDNERPVPVEIVRKGPEGPSAVRNLLNTLHSDRVHDLLVPKSSPEAHFGFSRGGAAKIHDWSNSPLSHAHDKLLKMTPSNKTALTRLRDRQPTDVGDVIESRLGTDSYEGLVRELVEETNLTRRDAEALVARWMEVNNLTTIRDDVRGRMIVPKE